MFCNFFFVVFSCLVFILFYFIFSILYYFKFFFFLSYILVSWLYFIFFDLDLNIWSVKIKALQKKFIYFLWIYLNLTIQPQVLQINPIWLGSIVFPNFPMWFFLFHHLTLDWLEIRFYRFFYLFSMRLSRSYDMDREIDRLTWVDFVYYFNRIFFWLGFVIFFLLSMELF
jgi:hypothetical protein